VADFRYYCLSEDDRIIVGAHLVATDLHTAIRAAYEACRDHPHFGSTRIEVWQGTHLLYATAGNLCSSNSA
jgi:hypothetical protein